MLKGHTDFSFYTEILAISAELVGMRRKWGAKFFTQIAQWEFSCSRNSSINFTANVYKVLIEYSDSIFWILNSLAILNQLGNITEVLTFYVENWPFQSITFSCLTDDQKRISYSDLFLVDLISSTTLFCNFLNKYSPICVYFFVSAEVYQYKSLCFGRKPWFLMQFCLFYSFL